MKHRGMFAMVLISLAVSSSFADTSSVVQSLVMESLSNIYFYIKVILVSMVSIFLVPLAWFYVKKSIDRDSTNGGVIVSNISSRSKSRDRLKVHGIGEKELNLRSHRNAVKAEKFRKKFGTFEEWQGSSDYRKTRFY